MTHEELAEEMRILLGAEAARVTAVCGTLFLILGRWRNAKDDKRTVWFRNGERWDFPYLEQRVVASGGTEAELRASAQEYKRLRGMTAVEYLTEIAATQRERAL